MGEHRNLICIAVAFLVLSIGVTTTAHAQTSVSPTEVPAVILSGREIVTTVEVPGGTTRLNNGPLATAAVGIVTVAHSSDGTSVRGNLAASAGSGITGAHLHLGPEGANGPVLFTLFDGSSTQTFPQGQLEWKVSERDLVLNRRLDIKNFRDAVNSIRSGNTYIDIHTEAFPEGEIRGQLKAPNGGELPDTFCGDYAGYDCICSGTSSCSFLKWVCDCTGGTYKGGTHAGTCDW